MFFGYKDVVVSLLFVGYWFCFVLVFDDRILKMWDLNEFDNKQGWIIQNELCIKCVVCFFDGLIVLLSLVDNIVCFWDFEVVRQYD